MVLHFADEMEISLKRVTILLTIWGALVWYWYFTFFQTTTWFSLRDQEYLDDSQPVFLEIQYNEFYSISAFFDDRIGDIPTVKVMGVGILKKISTVKCTFLDEERRILGDVLGKHEILYVKTGRKFQGIWVNCPVLPTTANSTESLRPNFVSLSTPYSTNSVAFPISYPPVQNGFKYKMAMCVQPFFGQWENPIGLIEWIEFHKLLGAEHFTFYYSSLGEESAQVLASYGAEVVLLPWNVTYDPNLMQNNAQVVQINDCLYRYMGVAELVGSVDVDEFIMPGTSELKGFQNYFQMFKGIEARKEAELKGKAVASIKFASKFSFEQFPYTSVNGSGLWLKTGESTLKEEELEIANRLQTFTRLNRASSSKFSYKTKLVAFPHHIIESEVHSTPKVLENTTSISVPQDEVHFVHFRNCTQHYIQAYCGNRCNSTCWTMPYEEDTSMVSTFGKKLLENVMKKIQSLSHLNLMLIDK